MTTVTGTKFGSWTLVYDDESRPTSISYPTGTDSFLYTYRLVVPFRLALMRCPTALYRKLSVPVG